MLRLNRSQANYPDLASAINTKGGVMNIFSVVIIGIAGVGILNLLLMAIYERTREIGMLGAMGLKPAQISLLFILEGIMIGLVGVAVGIVLGLALNGLLMKVGLDFGSLSSVTSYMALIKGKVYPTWGTEKLVDARLRGGNHLRAGSAHPCHRSRAARTRRSPALCMRCHMLQLFKMSFRDLGRNRRRSFFSALAVSVGLAILMLMASVVNGEMGSAHSRSHHP